MTEQLPYVGYLELGDEPHLVAQECGSCGALFLDRRNACASCGRSEFSPRQLSGQGALRAFTIVHRATPEVQVPYVSAIVDLDGGGTIKGNLINVEPVPEKIRLGMPVEVVYKDALGRKDREGNSYLSYFFQPRR